MANLVIIGDVGGHVTSLVKCLQNLGADVSKGTLPRAMTVVSVGDLVDRGPNSNEVVELVDRFLKNSNWVQLLGNHEEQYLFGSEFEFFPKSLSPASVKTINYWWENNLMKVAGCFTTKGVRVRQKGGTTVTVGTGNLLITHAGLTYGAWSLLGRCGSDVLANKLNDLAHRDLTNVVWREGVMTTGVKDMAAGPLWAGAEEVYESWLQKDSVVPNFHQVHGHSTAFSYRTGKFLYNEKQLRQLGWQTHVDRSKRIVRSQLGKQTIWGVDPNHTDVPAFNWSPLVLELE